METSSDFLFATNGYVVGAGSASNFWGDYFPYNRSKTTREADARAISADWRVAGNDIRRAGKKLKKG